MGQSTNKEATQKFEVIPKAKDLECFFSRVRFLQDGKGWFGFQAFKERGGAWFGSETIPLIASTIWLVVFCLQEAFGTALVLLLAAGTHGSGQMRRDESYQPAGGFTGIVGE